MSTDTGFTWTENQLTTTGGSLPQAEGAGDTWAVSFQPAGGAAQAHTLAGSRDGALSFGTPVALSGGSIGNGSELDLSFNLRYENFAAAWLDDTGGADHPIVGGARVQTLTPVSATFQAGTPIHFEVEAYPLAQTGRKFAVIVAPGTGNFSCRPATAATPACSATPTCRRCCPCSRDRLPATARGRRLQRTSPRRSRPAPRSSLRP